MKVSKPLYCLIIIFIFSSLLFSRSFTLISARECNEGDPQLQDICLQLNKLEAEKASLEKATAGVESSLKNLEDRINLIQKDINAANTKLKQLENEILDREVDLEVQKKLLAAKVRDYYISSHQFSPLLIFLASANAAELTRELFYRQSVADQDKRIIIEIAQALVDLKNDQEDLENRKASLDRLQADLDTQAAPLRKDLEGAKAYEQQLFSKIAELTAKQQSLLAEKFASMPVPLLAYTSLKGCSSDIGKDSGFSPRFGFFSYGVPNKTGLNQYGAKGRAEAGQSVEQILQAYYHNFQIVDYGTGFNITVNGTNEYGQTFNNEAMNIEEYLKHLYEMPTSWSQNALQAQVIAARSYALARTNNGQSSIPPNQSGQVVKKELNTPEWVNAVTSTSGKVMVQNGNPISAWYSSTHGGVVLTSGQIGWNDTPWTKQAIDTPSGAAAGFSELNSNAYDKQSPWFFCDWGYRGEYNNTAWLKMEEVVDIVNAYLLWEKDNGTIVHLSQTDKPTGDTWSAEQVKQEIINRGGTPISSINSIGVGWDGSGISKTISVNGRNFDAQKFKNLFNLRAPGNIQIKPTCTPPDSTLNCPKMYALYDVVRE